MTIREQIIKFAPTLVRTRPTYAPTQRLVAVREIDCEGQAAMNLILELARDHAAVTAAMIAAVVGFVGSTVALIIGWRQGTSARLSAEAAKASADAALLTAKAAGDRAVATMRLQWVQDLRRILSEYHSVLVSYEPADYRQVSELGTQLDLMLNLDEKEQRELWEVAEEIYRTEDKDKRVALDSKLMSAGRQVLKKEWKTIKWELRGKGHSQLAA